MEVAGAPPRLKTRPKHRDAHDGAAAGFWDSQQQLKPRPQSANRAVVLDPLKISGPLSLLTPICVLAEVIECYPEERQPGESYEDLAAPSVRASWIEALSRRAAVELPVPLTEAARGQLAYFVNSAIHWKYPDLWAAFQELRRQSKELVAGEIDAARGASRRDSSPAPSCCGEEPSRVADVGSARLTLPQLREMVEGAEVSRPFPGKKTLTASFLYRAATWLGVPLSPFVGAPDLKKAVLAYLGGYGSAMAATLILKAEDRPASVDRYLLPKTDRAAVELAAENYSLDLSFVDDPTAAYLELMSKGISGEVADLKARNAHLCNLDFVYNPELNYAYTKSALANFARSFGIEYPRSDSDSAAPSRLRSSLAAALASNHFWEGWYPAISNKQTPFALEEVENLPSDRILCFGSPRDGLVAYTYAEVSEFMHNQETASMLAPGGGVRPLEKGQVSRLAWLLKKDGGDLGAKRRISMELARLSESVVKGEQAVAAMFREFGQSEARAKQIGDFLERLFVLAMVMRGWDGKKSSQLPLREPIGSEDDPLTHERTSRALVKLESSGGLLDLPLLRNLSGTFQRYTASGGGATIRERLKIVRSDSDTNYQSCIRMTSNVLAWTSLYYMGRLGLKAPIKTEELRSVA